MRVLFAFCQVEKKSNKQRKKNNKEKPADDLKGLSNVNDFFLFDPNPFLAILVMSGRFKNRGGGGGASSSVDAATTTTNERILRECHSLYTHPETG